VIRNRGLELALFCLSFGAALCAQTTSALRQSFNAPKTDVEQALKDLNAYQSGRLPFIDGFVETIGQPTADFQRAYYQYTISVQQVSDAEVAVSVNAKISAWYEDKDATKSGYRDLPSNGRLEEDLLDRLRTKLRKHAEELAASRVPLVSPRLLGITPIPVPTSTPEPDAPQAAAASPRFQPFTSPAKPPSSNAPPTAEDARYERLVREEHSLNDVIAAQQHPNDLVAIKSAHTPITASPGEGSRVLMYADAEDEFQFLKSEGGWVHVQISGLNRGWIRSSQVEMPHRVEAVAKTAPEAFHQTKEETSTFPGDWAPLRGKNVKIIWVQPNGASTQKSRLSYAESVFRKQAPQVSSGNGVEGVVVVFDAAEGGMAATTVAALQEWGSGSLSDAAFLKQCWFDPADAFTASASR
jgi:hypothetical protein